jgi:hypothetical protein
MSLRAFTLLLAIAFTLLCLSLSASAKTLFFDDFEDGVISKAYIFKAGQNLKWSEENGVLVQKNKLAGDPVYAIIADKEYPKALTVETKLRVEEWETGPCARTGVAVRVSKDTGEGLAFLFSDHRVAKPRTGVAFLDDHIVWGPLVAYEWKLNSWYWFQLHIDENDKLYAKVWPDGQKPPAAWTAEIANFGATRKSGYPGLNAGSSVVCPGSSIVSFDRVEVWDKDGSTLPALVTSYDRLTTTWGKLKVTTTYP